jgi:hypothetical protein
MIRKFSPWSLLLLCFLCGCAKQVYYFPADRGASAAAQQNRQQQEAVVSELFSPAGNAVVAEEAPGLASLEAPAIEDYQPSPEARARARQVSGRNAGTSKGAGLTHLRLVKKKKWEVKKTLPDAEKKPARWGRVGLVLSLLGLGFLGLGLALAGLPGAAVPIILSLGLLAAVLGTVFSGLAVSKMKIQPQNREDWKAIAGLILGLSTLGLYLALFLAFLLIMAFVNALSEFFY